MPATMTPSAFRATFRRTLLLTGLMLLVISACSTQHSYLGSFRKADLPGAVYGATVDGAPLGGLAGARVALDGGEPVIADSRGRFLIPDVHIGPHRLQVSRDGYIPVDREIEFLNRSQVVYVRLVRVDEAVDALAADFASAENALPPDLAGIRRRALTVVRADPRNPVARYALALVALETGMSREAAYQVSRMSPEYRDLPYVRDLEDRALADRFLRAGPATRERSP